MEKIKTLICIIGAGPSGATCSIFLSKMGIAHVIVDAAVFPRDKICGDGIDLNAVRILNHIDPDLVETELAADNINFSASQGIRFISPNGRQFDILRPLQTEGNRYDDKPIYYVSKRIYFDALLVSKIDPKTADLRLSTRIDQIRRNGNLWNLEGSSAAGKIEIEAGFLIGADGDHSVVLRHLGMRKIDRVNYGSAVRQYWNGVEGLHKDNLLEVYFPKKLPLSYFWIFPLPNGKANVGYGMISKVAIKKNINIRKTFEGLIKTDPLLAARFKNAEPEDSIKGWGAPMSGNKRPAHGDGWLLLGDAASMICPTSGEGIGSGMITGFIAAKFIQRAVHENDFSQKMFTHYSREIHKRMRAEEKIFRFISFIPGWLFLRGVNLVLTNRFFKNWLSKKGMRSWVITAYDKELEVNLN